MDAVEQLAPIGNTVVDYDRHHLALYAELLDAADAGGAWQETAVSLMQLDISRADSEACWRSHVERARWIIGEGLAAAVTAFGVRPKPSD